MLVANKPSIIRSIIICGGILLDQLDRRLLNLIQEEFPLVARPYQEIGCRLGLSEDEVIRKIRKLKTEGIIRRLGGVFELRQLGYTSTLCALKVPPGRLEEVAAVVNSFPGVTHNYLREHDYNMWFTLIGPDRRHLENVIRAIKERTGITELLELPAERPFKIRVNFDLEAED
ncbi:siroheme decarboxylase subunit alpha [Neomoorella thermoacetica]|uniref:siroheme decarboxylase n=1 Tax=Moorella thermoacetica (strain ATCC 39073 / JCM 9320) TaxID=264732 RepID=Q2RGF2_MOOTA